MDPHHRLNHHHRRRPSSDRFLTTFSPPTSSSTPLTTTAAAADDFSEDDILFTATTTTTTTTTVNNHLPPPSKPPPLRPQRSFKLEPSGILAALPDPTPAVVAASPARTISIIPQVSSPATSDHHHRQAPFSLPAKYHQSAPMHVPTMPALRGGRRQRRMQGSAFGFESIDDGEAADGGDDDDDEMLPPHEMVARRLAETPVLSSSVLEGAGRTLKGRDLRQVRNAVFRHTGFID